MKFEVTFEATGFTNNAAILDAEFSEQEAIGFSEVSHAEGTFPPGILAVKRGFISSDDGQGKSDIRVFVGVVLVVEADTEADAENFTPPEGLLTHIADCMGSVENENQLDLEAHSWLVVHHEQSVNLSTSTHKS